MKINKYKTKDTEYGEGYGNGYEKGAEDQKREILNMIEKMPETFPEMESDEYDEGFGIAKRDIIKRIKKL